MQWTHKVVVITGATSGIGRAAAIEFAARGATVVLAGRRAEALATAAHDCRAAGGTAVTMQVDVTRESEVRELTQVALRQSGVIDVWINNAGVTLFGSLEDAPLEEHRRVIETNLFGAVHGARAVLPVFRRQQRGVLISVGSVLSQIGQPFVPSYVISKFGLRGLSEVLRAEVADQPDIFVCTLLPYAVDTEHFENGANYLGLKAHAMPPMQSPEKVARALVHLAEHPVRERYVPRVARLGVWAHAVFPRAVERVIFDVLSKWHLAGDAQAPHRGNLYQPQCGDGGIHGERPAQVGTGRLVAYALPRLAAVQAALTWHALRRRIKQRVRSTAVPEPTELLGPAPEPAPGLNQPSAAALELR